MRSGASIPHQSGSLFAASTLASFTGYVTPCDHLGPLPHRALTRGLQPGQPSSLCLPLSHFLLCALRSLLEGTPTSGALRTQFFFLQCHPYFTGCTCCTLFSLTWTCCLGLLPYPLPAIRVQYSLVSFCCSDHMWPLGVTAYLLNNPSSLSSCGSLPGSLDTTRCLLLCLPATSVLRATDCSCTSVHLCSTSSLSSSFYIHLFFFWGGISCLSPALIADYSSQSSICCRPVHDKHGLYSQALYRKIATRMALLLFSLGSVASL